MAAFTKGKISTHPRTGTVTHSHSSLQNSHKFQLTPTRGHVAQAAEFILRRGGCRIGMHIEKTAEVRDADAARLRGDFGIISQLCGLRARQVRANRASERLHDRDFRGRNFNSPPRGDGNLIASPCSTPSSDFNSPPRGDKDFHIPRRGFFFQCLYFLSLCCIMFSQAVYLSDNEEEPHGNGALCVILSRRYDGPDFR